MEKKKKEMGMGTAFLIIAAAMVVVLGFMIWPEEIVLLLCGLAFAGLYALFTFIWLNLFRVKLPEDGRPNAKVVIAVTAPELVLVLLPVLALRMGRAMLVDTFPLVPLFLILTPVLCLWRVRRGAAAVEQQSRKQFDEFYAQCEAYGLIREGQLKPQEVQRLELLAKQAMLPFDSPEQLHRRLLEERPRQEAAREAEAQRKKEEARQRDLPRLQALSWCVGLHGREKPLQILAADSNPQITTRDFKPLWKESDGMLAAGAAAGIGGVIPAAAALHGNDRYNEKVRAHNEAAAQYNEMMGMAMEYQVNRGRELEELKKRFSTKLVSDEDPAELMKHLTVSGITSTVTRYGSVWITARVRAEPFCIFEQTPAVVDGWLKAEIMDGEQKIGQAALVFPLYGSASVENGLRDHYLATRSVKRDGHLEEIVLEGGFNLIDGLEPSEDDDYVDVTLMGLCPCCGREGKEYQINLVPGDLWAMER